MRADFARQLRFGRVMAEERPQSEHKTSERHRSCGEETGPESHMTPLGRQVKGIGGGPPATLAAAILRRVRDLSARPAAREGPRLGCERVGRVSGAPRDHSVVDSPCRSGEVARSSSSGLHPSATPRIRGIELSGSPFIHPRPTGLDSGGRNQPPTPTTPPRTLRLAPRIDRCALPGACTVVAAVRAREMVPSATPLAPAPMPDRSRGASGDVGDSSPA